MRNEKQREFQVCVVAGSLDLGGTELHLLRLFSELNHRGYQTRIVTVLREGELAPLARRNGVAVHTPRELKSSLAGASIIESSVHFVTMTLSLIKEFRKHNADIICLYLPHSIILGVLAHFMSGNRGKVFAFRRSLNNYQKKHRLLGLIEKRLLRYPSIVVGNSEAVVQQLLEEGKTCNERVRLIYNGVDISKFCPDTENLRFRSDLQVSSADVVLTAVANLIPYKGHTDLIKAMSLLPRALRVNLKLICVGSGIQQRADLVRLTAQYGLEAQVKWIGSRRDVSRILLASDIGVLPSHEEGFSNAILEGMAAGLPMVVTDVGGNSEAVIDGQTGFVVPSKNPPAMTVALERLIADAELRKSMGNAGRQRVEEFFSLHSCVEAHETLFQEVLGRQ